MLYEVNKAKDFLIKKFGCVENVDPNIYSIPLAKDKFMRVEILADKSMRYFDLFKDEKLTIKHNHGGARPNSGRPKLGKKKYLITCLPQHIETIREFIKQLHESK